MFLLTASYWILVNEPGALLAVVDECQLLVSLDTCRSFLRGRREGSAAWIATYSFFNYAFISLSSLRSGDTGLHK